MEYFLPVGMLFVVITTLSSQGDPRRLTQVELTELANISPNSVGIQAFDAVKKETKGSPLLFEDWKKGKLLFEENNFIGPEVLVNIDVIKSQVWFQLENGMMGQLPNHLLHSIIIYNDDVSRDSTLIRLIPIGEVEGNKNQETGFYEILYNGSPTFLKRTTKTFMEADYDQPYGRGTKYDEYRNYDRYYLEYPQGQFSKIKLKANAISKVLGKEVKKIIKTHDLFVENETDVILLLQYLNEEEHD